MNSLPFTFYANKLFWGLCSCILVFWLFSCEKEKKDPVIETVTITGLSSSEYYVSAKIAEKGDFDISDYGFAYYIGSGDGSSIYNYQKVSVGNSLVSDTFSTVLNIGQYSYYTNYRCFARAYVTNEKGTMYGKPISTELVRLALKSLQPSKGRSGDTITLLGSYFNHNLHDNQVHFNYTDAEIISGTTQSLRVIVPGNISSYYSNTITVKVASNGEESSLQDGFSLYASPEGFSPAYGSWNSYIYITGSGMYNASLYFDNVFVQTNTNSSSSFGVSVPSNILKKKFKLYLSLDGVKTEIPGGYFTMDELYINEPSSTEYSRGASIYFYGNGLNPESSYTKLMLGNTTIYAYSSSNNYAYFDIPYSIALGTYVAKITNSVDTITLSTPLTIVAK